MVLKHCYNKVGPCSFQNLTGLFWWEEDGEEDKEKEEDE